MVFDMFCIIIAAVTISYSGYKIETSHRSIWWLVYLEAMLLGITAAYI